MRDTHEPASEFVNRLEANIRADIRRRNRFAVDAGPRWAIGSPLARAAALVTVVLVSMAVGGGAVVAAYQVKASEQRDTLLSAYQQRVILASAHLGTARAAMAEAEKRVSVGQGDRDIVLEARQKVVEAEAQLSLAQLDIDEIRASGREPQTDVSAALVSGRDFLKEHWQLETSIVSGALDLEKQRLAAVERRVAVGAASQTELEQARTRLAEVEYALQTWQRKIDIRQGFLKGNGDAATAGLFVLFAEAQYRRQSATVRLKLANTEAAEIRGRVQIGTASTLEANVADLRVLELQVQLSKVQLELAQIQKQLDQRGK